MKATLNKDGFDSRLSDEGWELLQTAIDSLLYVCKNAEGNYTLRFDRGFLDIGTNRDDVSLIFNKLGWWVHAGTTEFVLSPPQVQKDLLNEVLEGPNC